MNKALFVFLFIMASHGLFGQIVKQTGWLQVKGGQLCDARGDAVVLRGMSFGWHNFHPRFYNEAVVKWLHNDWHCNVIRAAMGVEPKAGYLQDSAGAVTLIENVADACIKEGIYVVIDWHSHNINLPQAAYFFERVAKKYGKYPNVIFELFNEPDHESWEEVKSYAEQLIPVIRKYAKHNIILVGNPHWDQDIHLPASSPITRYDKNIMYTLHYYAATHKQSLRNRGDSALKNRLPIFISESAGMEATGNGSLNMEEWQRWIEWSEKNKISWITWSVSDKDESCSVLQKSAGSDGNWSESDLKDSGIKIRSFLRKYNVLY